MWGIRDESWPKLDIVAKFLSSVCLAALTIVVGCGAREIADAAKTGELVRGLIADLTTTDQHARRDLALIALDHAADKQDPELIVDVAETLLLEYHVPDSLVQIHDVTSSVAYRILLRRDAARARRVLDSAEVKASRLQSVSISSWDTTIVRGLVPIVARVLPTVTGNVVYIQFRDPSSRERMELLRQALREQGLNAPGVEQVDGEYRNWVRYFHEEDEALAGRIIEVVRGSLAPSIPLDLTAQGVFNQKTRVPRGQIEVWLNP
jgi:hypothetical protein